LQAAGEEEIAGGRNGANFGWEDETFPAREVLKE
jgi:hypothetical protein